MHYLRYQYISQLVYLILALAESLGAPQYSVPEFFFFFGGGSPQCHPCPSPTPPILKQNTGKSFEGL